MNEQQVEKALEYFYKEPILKKLLQGLLAKYKSLGRFGGSVTIEEPNAKDSEVLSRFLRRQVDPGKKVQVKAREVEEILNKSRFSGVKMEELLRAHAGGELLTEKDIKKKKDKDLNRLFTSLKEHCNENETRLWIESLAQKERGSSIFYRHWNKDPGKTEKLLEEVISVLGVLNSARGNEYFRLPILAAKETGDPHGLDPGTVRGRFFISALNFLYHLREGLNEYSFPRKSEGIHELWEYFGVIKDDINSFVICAGFKGKGEGSEILQTAFSSGRVLNLPLRELSSLEKVYPGKGDAVFIVENPAVFSALVDCFAPDLPAIVCTNGQLRLAGRVFLDLVPTDYHFFYAGDFDPEGLLMAQNFLQRWSENSYPWRINPQDYHKTRSGLKLSPARLKRLENINHPSLEKTKLELQKHEESGYQESLLREFKEDIQRIIS